MTYFDDLSPYSYLSEEERDVLNIGWLDMDHAFPRGETSDEFIERLAWLCVYSQVKCTPQGYMDARCVQLRRLAFTSLAMKGTATFWVPQKYV